MNPIIRNDESEERKLQKLDTGWEIDESTPFCVTLICQVETDFPDRGELRGSEIFKIHKRKQCFNQSRNYR